MGDVVEEAVEVFLRCRQDILALTVLPAQLLHIIGQLADELLYLPLPLAPRPLPTPAD